MTQLRTATWIAALAALLTLAGCSGSATPDTFGQKPPANAPAPDFVDIVWRVNKSNDVEPGMTYTFRADGTLLIASPHGTPATGTWRRVGKRVMMVEEGIEYPVEILELTADRFHILINNPGTATDIMMVPADR